MNNKESTEGRIAFFIRECNKVLLNEVVKDMEKQNAFAKGGVIEGAKNDIQVKTTR